MGYKAVLLATNPRAVINRFAFCSVRGIDLEGGYMI